MCCFSQPVELVSNTNIFARSANGRQFLVYSMAYAARTDLAMVLPLPVPPRPPEDAVTFINLERYPDFFEDMSRGFPKEIEYTGLFRSATIEAAPKLRVHDVGDFEASFVPQLKDFNRLDERFRIPAEVWDRLPAYQDYGFAVFKLKASVSRLLSNFLRRLWSGKATDRAGRLRRVHPMGFSFPRRNTKLLYFPTVHVHDQELHPHALFDHMLYCQPDSDMCDYLQDWEESSDFKARDHGELTEDEKREIRALVAQEEAQRGGSKTGPRSQIMKNAPEVERCQPRLASAFMDCARTKGIVEPNQSCWRLPLRGQRQNIDTLLGKAGSIPQPATV